LKTVDIEGRYLFSIKHGGTKTGRYSSDFQQAPRPDKEKTLPCTDAACLEIHYEPDEKGVLRPVKITKKKRKESGHSHLISVRRLVIASPGKRLICGDYNQLELRLIAHFSQDPILLDAYRRGLDLHTATAEAAGILRADAKTVNFGLAYGLTLSSLIEQFGPELGAKLFAILREKYKVLMRYTNAVHQACRIDEFIRTLAGRKRRLPEINDNEWHIRAHAERQAFNAEIQGSGADIVKLAQREVARKIPEAKALLQVHDELVYEAEEDHADEMAKEIKYICENVVELAVPLLCEPKVVSTWRSAK
jgi:DNA polymerase I